MSIKISAENVDVSIKNRKILDNINFTIKNSEKISILGSNGSGKTTLIYAILKAVKINKGKIYNEYLKKNKKIGISMQEFKLNGVMTVKDTLKLFCTNNNYMQLLEILNLKNQLNDTIRTLSTGEYQKLNYIIAVDNNPELLILDEITTGIDTESRFVINKHLQENINSETTTIHVTHYLKETDISDRLLFLKEGKLVEDGKKDVLFKKYNLMRNLQIEAINNTIVKSKFEKYKHEIINNTIIFNIDFSNSDELLMLINSLNSLSSLIINYRIIEPSVDDLYNKIYLN